MDLGDRLFICVICVLAGLAHINVVEMLEANTLLIEQLTYEQCGKSNYE